MQKILDHEKWQPVNVSTHFLTLLEKIHNPNYSIPSITTTGSKEILEPELQQIISDDIPYWCTTSLLFLINSISEFIELLTNIKEISIEACQNLIDLLKVFFFILNQLQDV